MKRKIRLLTLIFLTACVPIFAQSVATNSPAARIHIEPSSAPTAGFGRATLSLGILKRAGEIFVGNYQVKVSPYSFRNEKGKLEISVSDECLANILKGRIVTITGTATNSENGRSRIITAVITPKDSAHGSVKISFNAGSRKLVFDSSYHFT